MRIGYACIPSTMNLRTNRGFNLKSFNEDIFIKTVDRNLEDLYHILANNCRNNIYLFRISSDIIPFGSHEVNNLKWWDIFRDKLNTIGKFIRENDIRVSMHPGQFTVLNSPGEDIVKNAIRDIEYHTLFLDTLGVDYSCKIVLHGGGIYGDKPTAVERFKLNFRRLSSSARRRLVLENDERSYTIDDILSICSCIDIPAVFDNLHHKLNNTGRMDFPSVLKAAAATWRTTDGPMKLHYSDEDPDKRKGAHSKFVLLKNFLEYAGTVQPFNADVMLEVKDKDISAIKCINSMVEPAEKSLIYEEWARYKYAVMEKSYAAYKECSSIVKSGQPLKDLYFTIDEALMKPLDIGSCTNTAEHVWGYFKDSASQKEKEKFFMLLKSDDFSKLKENLYRLAEKYKVEYLLKSYYFIY